MKIKKSSIKGKEVQRETDKMMKEIASIKSNLDQTLSSSALKDNEFNLNENENKNN